MAPLEWDKIMKADMENLANDGDTFYEMLKDFDPEKESNVDRLKQLFRVCQGVMNVKHDELGEFIIDMESEAKKDAETVDKLQKKVKELEIELRNAKKFSHDKESVASTKYLRETVSELEDQVHQLNKQKHDLQRDLNEEKRANEKYSDQTKKLEIYNTELRDEIDQMRQDQSYYKKQLQLHRDNLMTQEEPEYKLKLIAKNQELSEAMEELQNLTDSNIELKKNCEILTSKLSEVTKNMEQLTDDYLKRKQINQEQDTVNDRLRTENINMKAQISDLNEKLQTKSESDDAIMVAVSHKVEEWKAALAEKDEEINTYQKEAMMVRRKLEAIHMDADRASVDALTKVIEEKDKQINELTEEIKNYAEEMEINAAVFEDLKKNSKSEKGPVDFLYKKIQEQQFLLRQKDQELKEANKLVKEADKDTCDKEKQLCETLERIRQYESGEYGLTDAVSEIKELKKQLKIRERKNEELSQLINKSESDMNDVTDENEWLREQLGMDPKRPLDLKDFQSKISVKREEQRALNIVLQKEVERLEEERLMLKQNLRKLAQQTGQRAVALGLSADDMVSIQNYTENLKASKLNKTASQDAPEMEVLKVTNVELNKDLKNNLHQIEKLSKEKNELQIRFEELKQENQSFQKALKEILDDLKKRNSSDTKKTIIECPSLEKMIAALDARTTGSNSDMLSYAKAKADALQNENEELTKAVQNAKQEAHSAKLEAAEKIRKLEQDILLYQQQRSNQADTFQPLLLPEGLPASSAQVIANLNEHLIITLEDMFKKDEHFQETEISLENYQSKMAVIKHQLGLLYSDYLQEKQEYESETKKLKEKLEKLEELRQHDEIQLKEFERCLDTLSHDDVEVRRRLAEQTRKITVLQINEKALTRRYNSLVEVEGTMRKEISKLKSESIAMEKAVAERFGYLQRFKDTAMFKISALQKALEESVPSVDLERANKEYQNLTEKYRDLLEKENLFVLKSESVTNLEEDVKKLSSENDLMKKVLEMEKDKVHTLEASLENLFQKGVATSEDLHVSDNVQSLAKRMAMVEMKELHERQRAEHAVHMYEKYKTVLRDLERRNTELEENLSKVSQVNLELQKIERDLRDELANSVTKDVSDADRKKNLQFEENEVNLKNEISKLKEISDIATSQVRALETQHISRDKEVISLQQQLVDFQGQSDEKTVIGKLHRHIVQLQISEGTALQKLESGLQKLSKCESQVLRLEQQIDEKNQTIYHNRTEAQNKIKHLKQNLYDLRRQFAGAVPLSKQETFTRNMVQIREDKLKTEEELLHVQEQRRQMEDKVAELQLIQSSQRELLEATVKDSQTGSNKLVEWHSKLEVLRLAELKQKRLIVQLEEKISFLEKTNGHQERTINELERNSVRISKEFEERQLVWEQRELELELVISRMEKRASDIAGVAAKFGKTVGNIPDASEPVAVQLEQAISTIKQNMKTISDTQAESQVLKQQTKKLESALREAEKALIEKDKIISEIRLRMPATTDRDTILRRATTTAIQSHRQDPHSNDVDSGEQAMKVAQCAISSLKARIKLKEESIEKLQDLLKTAHDDMEKMNRNHFEQLQQMQLKIHENKDKSFHNFKEAARDLVSKADTDSDFHQQLSKMANLEELVAEHEDALNGMSERLKEKEAEILILRKKLQQTIQQKNQEKEDLLQQHEDYVNVNSAENEKLTAKIKDQAKEIEILKEEISAVKEANSRSPSANMKRLMEQLRNQLSLKESQNESLGKALAKIRAEMVEQAEETLKAHQHEKKQEQNVQALVEKHTEGLNEQIENLQVQNERLKNDLKKKRVKEQDLESQLEEAQEEITKKNGALQKLKTEKEKIQLVVEELEKKNDRMKSTFYKSSDGESSELNEMRRRIRFLEDQVQRKQEQAEKPYEQSKTEKTKNVELIKWEERKKWEKTIEKLKNKVKGTENEVEKFEKEVKQLKIALQRSREKELLEAKLKVPSKAPNVPPSTTGSANVRQDFHLRRELQDLKEINFQQTEELSRLKRQLSKDKDQIVKELAEENTFLVKEIEQLKKAVKAKFDKEKESQICTEYQAVFEKNQQLQKELLQLSKENIEIHFEMEQAKKDVPRLKARVEDLQTYVDALKEENNRLDGDRAGIKKVGESGKSPKELEKIIALLKKVVDRVQAENEKLKKLAVKVDQKEQKVEMQERKNSASHEKQIRNDKETVKLSADHEQLKKNFQKECEMRKKLESQVEQLTEANEKFKNRLTGGYTTVDKENADKMRNLEEELEKKHQILGDLKKLLRESAEREQSLLQERQELLKQIEILKDLPMQSVSTESKLTKNYQLLRLKMNQLEKEKAQLLSEVEILQKKIHGRTSESTKDMLEKSKEYDSLKERNVELQLEMKKMKFENEKIKNELDNFGPEFFEEIEQLKHSYKESVKKNLWYEDQLKSLGEKFGFPVKIYDS